MEILLLVLIIARLETADSADPRLRGDQGKALQARNLS